MERSKIPGLLPGQRHPDWRRLYVEAKEETLPWHFPTLDPDVAGELKTLRRPDQKILDVGCGLGNQAHLIGREGHQVLGTDVSSPAVERARVLYPDTRFAADDITDSTLTETFDIVLDRGCFHVLDEDARTGYLNSVHRLLVPRGLLWLKVMSTENPSRDFGPLCFTRLDLHQIFSGRFQLTQIRPTIYHGSTAHSPRAWFAVMRKKESHA